MDLPVNSAASTASTPNPKQSHIHKQLVHYATKSSRIFYIHDASAWHDFVTDLPPYRDLTSHELRNIFLTDVLPKVFLYPMPDPIKKLLSILDLHPCFRRVSQGYQYVPGSHGPINVQLTLKPNRDYCLLSEVSSARPCQTILVDTDGKNPSGASNVQLSPKTLAMLSSILSTDSELLMCQMHSLGEIHQRLRKAKQSFENNGTMAPYRSNINDLTRRLEIFVTVKKKVCQTMSDF
ncbi:uncharacterized protein Dwil_GK22526 [Drosophila willistoni]|uniref:Uncharacterized protein n=1 Tax=Drosophila willistoni TaxID=7260 RepID=B4NFH3_DROWI|nr:uncharacterized protein LOC6649580 [Drosophila willistoni]EDW83040.1 uncharacterized protein Dwil_GK22526 [Drosophila willistoni]